MKSKEELKSFFENGDIPRQEAFWEWQDSYWHKDENLPLYSYNKDKDTLIISPNIYHENLQKMAIFGKSVFPKLAFNKEIYDIDPWFLQRYVGFGTDIFVNFKGNVKYSNVHPANDSIVGFGTLLGNGFEYGTNVTLLGTAQFEGNDVKKWDGITAIGKGNTNGKLDDLDPHRVVNPISAPNIDIHSRMGQVVMVGHENWCNDIDSSVVIGSNNKIYNYVYNSVLIGTENQNYETDFTKNFDNDIVIGNGLNRANSKYKPSHNLIIGSTIGYVSGSWDAGYLPLIEGYMKHDDDPYLRINGRLELKNTNLNEMTKHSENLIEPAKLGSWTGNQEIGFTADNLNGVLVSDYIPEAGKSYYLKIGRSVPGAWKKGDWKVKFAGYEDINGETYGNQDYVVTQLIVPTTQLDPLVIEAINGTGELKVELYEILTDSEVDPIFNITGSDDKPVIEIRSGKSENNSLMIGKKSGSKQVAIKDTVAIGNNSAQNANIGNQSVIMGVNAMKESNSVSHSVAVGFDALRKYNGNSSTAVGWGALKNLTEGAWNDAFGNCSGIDLNIGVRNAFFGFYSAAQLQNGGHNTSIGSTSGFGLINGNNNCYFGARTAASSSNVNNEIVLGGSSADHNLNTGKGSNTVKIGNDETEKTFVKKDIEIEDIGKGIIMKSPNGTRFRVTVADNGAFVSTQL